MNRIARLLGAKPTPARLSPTTSLLAALAVFGTVLGGAFEAQAQSTPTPAPSTPAKGTSSQTVSAFRSYGAKTSIAVPNRPGKPASKGLRADPVNVRSLVDQIDRLKMLLVMEQAQTTRLKADLTTLRSAYAQKAKPSGAKPVWSLRTDAPVTMRVEYASASVSDVDTAIKEKDGSYDIDVNQTAFVGLMRAFARKSGLQMVIAPGTYDDVTLSVKGRGRDSMANILCRAGGAECRSEEGILYVTSQRPFPASSAARAFGDPGGGGFGGGLGGGGFGGGGFGGGGFGKTGG